MKIKLVTGSLPKVLFINPTTLHPLHNGVQQPNKHKTKGITLTHITSAGKFESVSRSLTQSDSQLKRETNAHTPSNDNFFCDTDPSGPSHSCGRRKYNPCFRLLP